MSETEHIKGKLTPVFTSTDPESACKLLADSLGTGEISSYYVIIVTG